MCQRGKLLQQKEEIREDLMKQVSMKLNELLYRGSVKDIYLGEDDQTLAFKFSNRYSVFDWGEMPDQLPQKGESLAFMGELFFSYLEKADTWKNWKAPQHLKSFDLDTLKDLKVSGLKHHCLGILEGDKTALVVKKVNVPKIPFSNGSYNYQVYNQSCENTLIPLEVIFRFGIPAGSSLMKRIGDDDYRRVLGLQHIPKEGESFSRPLIEFSTKLESTDRYIDYIEAQSIAGLNDFEFSKLFSLTMLVACRLQSFYEELGIKLWDGKFEWAFTNHNNGHRDMMLVDSIGPDELRLEFKEQKLSKEFLRGFYRNSSWLDAVERAKKVAKEKKSQDWKNIVLNEFNEAPKKLDSDFREAAENLYLSLANTFAKGMGKEQPFENALGLNDLSQKMGKL